MTQEQTDFSCYLLGGQSLLIRCGQLLLDRGHRILGVASDDAAVRRWAEEQALPLYAGRADALPGDAPFDYLFSIANFTVVPESVLALPRRAAINFHDGPLPEYAGLNVPTWALINHETEHGISWHTMTAALDQGDILKQKRFPIAPDETAFTLNAKCYDAAIECFTELVDELATGRNQPQVQDLQVQHYFARCRRPEGACTLDWSQPAEDIDALVRGLDYGPYRNPLGLPKLLTADAAYAVRGLEVLEQRGGAPAGTILAAGDFLTVATASLDVSLTDITDLGGTRVSGTELLARAGLAVGDVLPGLSAADRDAISDLDRSACKHEALWARRLASVEALELPFTRRGNGETAAPDRESLDYQLQAPLADALPGLEAADALLAGLLLYLSRVGTQERFDVAYRDDHGTLSPAARLLFETLLPWKTRLDHGQPASAFAASLSDDPVLRQGPHACARDLLLREPDIPVSNRSVATSLPIALVRARELEYGTLPDADLCIVVPDDGRSCRWHYRPARLPTAAVQRMQQQLDTLLGDLAARPDTPVGDLEIVPAAEKQTLLQTWNETAAPFDGQACIHQQFESRAAAQPDAPALSFQDEHLSYRQLNERANRLAHRLLELGVEPDSRVGILLDRSTDMVVAMLATLKAGAAYLPLDPDYPAGRIRYMIGDGEVRAVLSQARHAALAADLEVPVLLLDEEASALAGRPVDNPVTAVGPDNLAYTIYTSGSTGKPKGVMVEHRNVVSFFAGMDERLERGGDDTWLAVTSISFDISVLELLWTLTRGFHVVLHADSGRSAARRLRSRYPDRNMDFSLFYWNVASDDAQYDNDKYRLLLESARFGDRNGFSAVWTPERHFQSFGGLYPNPSVTSAALATITETIELRAGSCVLPLHSPIRVAEEWAVVDNLSNGRVGIAVAAGWQPNDFVIRPEAFENAKDVMFESTDIVKRLWRGETLEFPGATGKPVQVRTLPRPIRKELPVWVTTAGNPETYRQAGEAGANVLTHLLGQSVEELAEKIDIYRAAWREQGHPGEGQVTLLLHTLVGDDEERVKETARGPMKNYLKSAVFLVKAAAWNFPTFKKLSEESGQTLDEYFDSMSERDLDELLDFAFERYYETSGLFGTPARCLAMVDRLKEIGVDEIGCLIDFGADTDTVLAHLPWLKEVRDLGCRQEAETADAGDYSLPALFRRHGVTHLQCTPSMASMLVAEPETRECLAGLRQMMVGGEAFPEPLARDLAGLVGGRVTNMYGPTETTIWSTTRDIDDTEGPVPIGRPIANTRLYVLDARMQPVPRGAAGELYIGGPGVVRGYHKRDELTAERFVADPFGADGSRLYRTGDRVRYREDGVLEYLGRIDNQVKILGYRIELGEIEARLLQHPSVREAAVLLREDSPGDKRLVAYVRPVPGGDVDAAALKAWLRETLPEFMVPAVFVGLDEMPLTPNGKIDRRALPAPEYERVSSTSYVAPATETESRLAAIWAQVLEVPRVGSNDNFFDLGGHSLTAIQVVHLVRQAFHADLSLQSIFRSPVLAALATAIDETILASADEEDLDRLLEELETMTDEDAANAHRNP